MAKIQNKNNNNTLNLLHCQKFKRTIFTFMKYIYISSSLSAGQ